ncbi:MAG TPA: hypothetical protein VGO53_08080 [Steroidobacteraceae bacterium]|jgi:hypothetical protein|nr:hypothetical protein [Steroidobacteraceae bacterium]
MRRYFVARALKIALIAIVALGVLSFAVMSLWNWLMPALFAVSTLTFWQALALLVLSRILFGGFRRGGGPFGGHWRQRMREHWQHMTPEERDRLQERFGRGRGHGHGRARDEGHGHGHGQRDGAERGTGDADPAEKV